MRFQHITAPLGSRSAAALPTTHSQPDRFSLIEVVRKASTALGLKAPIIATLDALLSCLPPKRSHNFVFASNATIAFKRNGISDRTIRRHVAQLAEAGLLVRSDSPNRKRFSKSDMSTGSVLRFGFDLSPLFKSYDQICAVAEDCAKQASHISFLRTKVRCAIARTMELDGLSIDAENALRTLRRKLTAEELYSILDDLVSVEENQGMDCSAEMSIEAEMSATDGQNVRHHHSSTKELIDSDVAEKTEDYHQRHHQVSIGSLVGACKEAASYLQRPAESLSDVIGHARTLAPMMGIDSTTYRAAEDRLGELRTAITVWGLLQMQGKIRQLGAYFRAITTGKRSAAFDPWAMINTLVKQDRLQRC
ncbi:replication protein C [Pseudotabrizicola sediminis]|uniref:Replication protein C n=1 Tax=Pseudotabrizicola sediminis TaxID=2486418 RepID=A0ABY2KH51_9RHOB|nr:plasmid replication protein RepC [Pseudotabrizicola sediminis]TGD41605.1 replication protein C [Pseudotabrizicola sediminis]